MMAEHGSAWAPGSPAVASAAETPADRSVWVAVRARPLVARERLDGAKACVAVSKGGAVHLGTWRQFSYDHACAADASQQEVYQACVSRLVDSVLEGYNATVLAYGPTGSGKTYTMGMGSALHSMEAHHGIIPRVIRQLFGAIAAASASTVFAVKAQFLEIYNEELQDLLAGGAPTAAAGSGSPPQQQGVAIRESPDGQILVAGAREVTVSSADELLRVLDAGTLTRATSGTHLNEQSSRSHAIFTIIVEQSISTACRSSSTAVSSSLGSFGSSFSSSSVTHEPSGSVQNVFNRKQPPQTTNDSDDAEQAAGKTHSAESCAYSAVGLFTGAEDSGPTQLEYRCSKFHLVDLAGSERASRSGAAGARFRETVNINQGLLALGNVISALSDWDRRPRHVPYRDSKLTRLLQNSLGGNSKTVMIACISSADDAVEESLNTLKYAARARNIRNRPVANRQCLVEGSQAVAANVQALQLQLLRHFAQQLLGTSQQAQLPELLLRDAQQPSDSGTCDDVSAASKNLQLLKELQAMSSKWMTPDALGCSSDQRPHAAPQAAQQLAELESKVAAADTHITRLQLELDICGAEQQAAEQAASVKREQQAAAWEELLQVVEQLHSTQQLTDAARQQLQGLADRQKQQASTELVQAAAQQRASLHSHPLPQPQSSSFELQAGMHADGFEGPTAAAASAQQSLVSSSSSRVCCDSSSQMEPVSQHLHVVQAAPAAQSTPLQVSQHLSSSGGTAVHEVAWLQKELAAASEHAEAREAAWADRLRQMQAELRRWRTRALAMQSSAADGQVRPVLPPPPQSPVQSHTPPASPSLQAGLQQEISFASPLLQQPAAQGQEVCPVESAQPSPQQQPAPATTQTQLQQQQHSKDGSQLSQQDLSLGRKHTLAAAGLPRLHLDASTDLSGDALLTGAAATDKGAGGRHSGEDDQVLFDADLASYISETDYTDLRCEDFEADSHLLAELQTVLSEKAALEEEKAAAQADAAAAQRAFEHSRAMLEGQLGQLAGAISSQEALIATLQANEAEAKQLGALYLERCRELEVQLADLSLDLQEHTAALARVEADAAASEGEKQRLRQDCEHKIAAVVQQMESLQKQMRQQDGAQVEKERQRAAGRVQQLQAELGAMRSQQDKLRMRLQERLTLQEKDAAAKARELASLKRAADSARKRILELEADNRRQRAALKARSSEAAAAQRQLREMASKVSPVRSRPGRSPSVSPRLSGFSVSPRAAASPQSRSACSPHHLGSKSPRVSLGPCSSASPRQQQLQKQQQQPVPEQDCKCSLRARRGLQQGLQVSIGQPAAAQTESQPADTSAAASARTADTTTTSSIGDSKQLLTKHVQLLVSEYTARHRLQQLQAKQAAVLARKQQLAAAHAELQHKQLQSCQVHSDKASAAGTESSRGSISSNGGSSSRQEAASGDPALQVLQSDLADQLDSVEAQLQHIQHLMRKAAADAAAAAGAAGGLLQAASTMGRQQLQQLLVLTLKELALQANECQETMTQAKRLQVELSEVQQQLHETSSRLHMVQLQHQTQLSQLQAEHERRAMRLLKQQQQPGTAAAVSEAQGEASTGTQLLIQQQQQQVSPLVGLLQILAQQGSQEQQQKLLSTLNRLQQLQQCKAAKEAAAVGDALPTQAQRQHLGTSHDDSTHQQQQQQAGQQSGLRQQQQVQQQPLVSPRQQQQLLRLKQCRSQQHLQQLQQLQRGQLSPRPQRQPQGSQQQQHLSPAAGQFAGGSSLQSVGSREEQGSRPRSSQQRHRHGEAQGQVQQHWQQELVRHSSAAHYTQRQHMADPSSSRGSSDSDGCSSDGCSSDGGISDGDERCCNPLSTSQRRPRASSSVGSSLRASASRLQAQLCGYRDDTQPADFGGTSRSCRSSLLDIGSCGNLHSSQRGGSGRSSACSSNRASPRASLDACRGRRASHGQQQPRQQQQQKEEEEEAQQSPLQQQQQQRRASNSNSTPAAIPRSPTGQEHRGELLRSSGPDALHAPAADGSPRKNTCKGGREQLHGASARSARAATAPAAAAAADASRSLDSPVAAAAAAAAPSSCKSPHQQFKASAAVAAMQAAAVRDQQNASPSPSSKGRPGVPLSSPSTYLKLLRGLNGV